ncbi:hypothetical protein Pr1d_35750 [Bythopirellula goksoeyrii]|uniref:Uncharacterized protein n=1 Tax=Bythopirellula goksoeyrii TaxID=1400387 RepID=A0A5B9QQL9_9BACT|nr:hypothetical protein Pr1d_35750 [Bythopirellula goksoeyrii]
MMLAEIDSMVIGDYSTVFLTRLRRRFHQSMVQLAGISSSLLLSSPAITTWTMMSTARVSSGDSLTMLPTLPTRLLKREILMEMGTWMRMISLSGRITTGWISHRGRSTLITSLDVEPPIREKESIYDYVQSDCSLFDFHNAFATISQLSGKCCT